MVGRWLVGGTVAALLVVGAATLAVTTGPRAATAQAPVPAAASAAVAQPRADSCASIGQAGNFAFFVNGVFNATEPSGTSIAGRIGAADTVTMSSISVSPTAGEPSPAVITGGDFKGSNGSLNGGVRYRNAIQLTNFTVNGAQEHQPPGFDFGAEFDNLRPLSASFGDLGVYPDPKVTVNPGSQALELRGTANGLNVFTVTAAQLATAPGIAITLTGTDPTALINVTTDTQLTIGPQYMSLSGVDAAHILWNLPLATGFAVNRGVAWNGSILAPNADVTGNGHPQLFGQIMADSMSRTDWVVYGRYAFTGCVPSPPEPPPEDTSLSMDSLCISVDGNLDMRMRNTGDRLRTVSWTDTTGTDFGTFDIPPLSDHFFVVRDGGAASVIRATSGDATVVARGTAHRCSGKITVHKAVEGDAPAGVEWAIIVDGGAASVTRTLRLGAGESDTVTVPGGYQPGTVAIGNVVGGIPYVIREDDPQGATKVTISNPLIQIIDDQNEVSIVKNTFPVIEPPPTTTTTVPPTEPPTTTTVPPTTTTVPPTTTTVPPTTTTVPPTTTTVPPTTTTVPPTTTTTEPTNPVEPPEPPSPIDPPVQPDVPPGAPDVPSGPDLIGQGEVGGESTTATDLSIANAVTPRRVPVGSTITVVVRIRNRGSIPAANVTGREIPQFRPAQANLVARTLSTSVSQGSCTKRRPVKCRFGTLAPGKTITVRSHVQVRVAANLHQVVQVSSDTPETNTANNISIASFTTFLNPALKAHVSAPPFGTVGKRFAYRVSVTGSAPSGAASVRLCAPRPSGVTGVVAPGTFPSHGQLCRKYLRLPNGRTVSFLVSARPFRSGPVHPSTAATAVDLAGAARASATVLVVRPFTGCGNATLRKLC